MAALNYLSGGESPTAASMNALFGTLDEKMKAMLGGKSFLLAQTSQVPHYLMGKCFFFTSGTTNYAKRAPDYLPDSGTPANTRAYNDSQFTGAMAALTSTGSYAFDEVNKIVTIPQISSSAYAGLPAWGGSMDGSGAGYSQSIGLFEWSLQACYLMHQGTSDSVPVKYYIQDGASSQPERRYKYALAELIIEGPTSVAFSASWDKYSCFRIHNLNMAGATVYFADGGYTVTLGALQCLTVRRDWNGSGYQNYRLGGSYFLPFEGGDPRFYWFTPTIPPSGVYSHAGNGMQANCITNPAIAYDWADFFRRTPDAVSVFCGWNDDPNVQCDIHSILSAQYGDPSNPSTIIGDLIHHKGDINIYRVPKQVYQLTAASVASGGTGYTVGDMLAATGGGPGMPLPSCVQVSSVSGGVITGVTVYSGNVDGYVYPGSHPASPNLVAGGTGVGAVINMTFSLVTNPYASGYLAPLARYITTIDKVTFNGYATIVSDFAAKSLTVTTNGSGDLQIANGDTNNNVTLYPISTNLLKAGEVCPVSVSLTSPFTIESAIFELEPDQSTLHAGDFTGAGPTLRNYAPQMFSHPSVNSYGNGKIWADPYATGDIYPSAWSGGAAYSSGQEVVYNAGGGPGPQFYNWIFVALQPNTNVTPGSNGDVWMPLCNVSYPYIVFDSTVSYPSGTIFVYSPGPGMMVHQLTAPYVGGSGSPAQVVIAQIGEESSAAYNYAVGDTYDTVTWSMSRSTYPVFHGIHSHTVADITALSWWDDPALAGIGFTASAGLTLTPNGLVLVVSEKDQGFPFMVARQFRFRGHGFGFSGTSDSGHPPSAKAGYFSPLYGRQIATSASSSAGIPLYSGEVSGFSGADFDVSGWSFSDTGIKIVGRPEAATVASNGRFYKIYGDALSGSTKAVAMPLTAEMYNGLARAVLSTTIAIPLQYQCLFFVVNGYSIPINSGYRIDSSIPYFNNYIGHVDATTAGVLSYADWTAYNGPRPMEQFCAFNDGSLFEALMTQLGIPVQSSFPGGTDEHGNEQPLSYFQSKYTLPAVMYDRIDVKTSDASTSWDAGTSILTCNAKLKSEITSELLSLKQLLAGAPTGSKCVGTYTRPVWIPTAPTFVPGHYSSGSPPFWIPDTTVYGYWTTPTFPDFTDVPAGSFYVASDGSGYILMGGAPASWVGGKEYNMGPWSYVIYHDFKGKSGGTEYYLFGDFPSPLLPATTSTVEMEGGYESHWTSTQGLANIQTNEIHEGGPYGRPGIFGGVNLCSYIHYRWVKISDMQAFIMGLGFPFNWSEASLPLKLVYTLDPFTPTIKDQRQGSESVTCAVSSPAPVDHLSNADGGAFWNGHSTQLWHLNSDGSSGAAHSVDCKYDPITQQITTITGDSTYNNIPGWGFDFTSPASSSSSTDTIPAPFTREDYINAQKWSQVNLNHGGTSIYGSQIRFVVTDGGAKWKTGLQILSNALPAGVASSFGAASSSWAEVYNITNNKTESPLTHFLDLSTASLNLSFGQPTIVVAFPDATLDRSVRPSVATHACLLAEYVAGDYRNVVGSQNGAWSVVPRTPNLLFTPGGAVWDQRQFIAFQIPDAGNYSEFIAMQGQGFWVRATDWLSRNVDNARAGSGSCPWIYSAAPPDKITAVNGGLSILTTPPQTRYRVFLPTLQYDLQTLPTYSSPTPFGYTSFVTNATGATGASTAATGASSGTGISGI